MMNLLGEARTEGVARLVSTTFTAAPSAASHPAAKPYRLQLLTFEAKPTGVRNV